MKRFDMKKRLACGLLMVVALGWVATAGALPPQKSQEPAGDADDEREFRRVLAQRLVRENCLICHAEEMIASQRLTPKQWKAEVEKMEGWGTPLPKEHEQVVIDYLTESFSATASPGKLKRLSLRQVLENEPTVVAASARAKVDLESAAQLYARNCANCHGSDAQGADLGPNLVEKPILHRRDAYLAIVRDGLRRMPGFVQALDTKAEEEILAWLRARTYQPPSRAK